MNDLSEFVTLNETTLTTDSRRVAKQFGKKHKNVLRIIDSMRDSSNPEIAEHHRLHFEPMLFDTPIGSGAMRKDAGYLMTQEGFGELAMSFTGDDARVIRIRFISAFRAMSEQLQQIGMNLWNQRLELEKKDATSFMWASFGAKRMLERKKALPDMKVTRERLLHEMEPALFGGSELLQ